MVLGDGTEVGPREGKRLSHLSLYSKVKCLSRSPSTDGWDGVWGSSFPLPPSGSGGVGGVQRGSHLVLLLHTSVNEIHTPKPGGLRPDTSRQCPIPSAA